MDILKIQSYYGEDENDTKESGLKDKIIENKKPLIVGIVVLVLILFIFLLFFNNTILGPKIGLSLDGNPIGFSGTLLVDGKIVDSFSQEGDPIIVQSNGADNINIVIGTSGINATNAITVRGVNFSGGQISASRVTTSTGITLSNDVVFIDGNGNIILNIDPVNDLMLDPSLIDFNNEESFNFEVYLVLYNPDTNEEYTLIIPVEIFFSEFLGSGCLQLSREYINGSTKYGQMEIEVKIRITCNSNENLFAFVEWKDSPKGSVEVHFDNTYPTTLISVPLEVKTKPVPGDYVAKIIYTPHELEKGKISDFKLNFKLQNSDSKITFSMVNENLEQCVMVTTLDDTIKNQTDTASIEIDTSKCINPVEIIICDNDVGCSGGVEGEILPSANNFTLNKSSRVISFSRGEIPGVYGATVHARVKGFNKTFISEKEIFVLPTDETIFPEQFVVSLIGKGARDSIQIKNTQLAQDVEINTSICNLYESSFGIEAGGQPFFGSFSNEKEWLTYLLNNPDSYAGEGFYQTALLNSLQKISAARSTAYEIGTTENAKIKQAYLRGQEFETSATDMRELSDAALDEVNDLDGELANINANAKVNLTSQIAGLVTSLNSLYTDISVLKINLSSAQTAVTTAQTTSSLVCKSCSGGLSTASNSLASANSNSTLLHQEALQLLNTAKNLYSIYQQVDALSNDSASIDSRAAVSNSTIVNEKLTEIENRLPRVLDYLDEALASAAVDSFETASNDHLESKKYLEFALAEMNDIEELKDAILTAQLAANNNLTVISDDSDERTELVIECISLILDLITLTGAMQTKSEAIITSLSTAQTGLTTAQTAADFELAECTADCVGATIGYAACAASCVARYTPVITAITSAQSTVGSAQSKATSTYASLMNNISTINSIYQYYQTYEQLTSDYITNLVNALEYFTEIIEELYDFELVVINLISDLEIAIVAADNLSNLEKELSDASTYLDSLLLSQNYGNYNRERLVGLVSTLVLNGFINGAYSGGVYTTRDTGPIIFSSENNASINKISFSDIKEDCDNKIDLILPSYKTNLIKDAKNIEIEGKGILSQWIFKNAKVNDVFESQIVDLLFVNDSLQKNSYATISIKFDEHSFDSPIQPTIDFQPFNLPSSSVVEKEYKFHMKFNATERTGATPNYNSNCENSLILGNTGPDALPKIILGWDWDDISIETVEDNYLDATQFSILLSKKLSSINDFLIYNQAVCPKNPVDLILEKVVPPIFNLDTFSENCFLPLSTKTYDNKPAVYYYLKNSSSQVSNSTDSDWGKINNANEFVNFVDFNINLMRDGFGLEFQDDFVNYYTKKLFNASPEFLDPITGMSRYFKNPDYLYFTSNEIDLLSKNDFSTTDSGLYNVKLLIDFKEFPLISGGRINSKIKVVLDLIKPINDNYSPFYYAPFNGGVGLSLDNDRRFYGTSLNSGSSFELIKNENISLNNNQRDSLFKINYVEQKDIFKLNSIKSNHSKLFTIDIKNNKLSIVNSPTLATPLLFEVNGRVNDFPFFEYSLLSGKNKLNAKTHNLFLFNSIVGCKDFGGNLMNYIKNSPDFLNGKNYAIGFDQALVNGNVFVKTIAYAPQDTDFAISYQTSLDGGDIISTGTSSSGLVQLGGIKGMNYNDVDGSSKINDLRSLFDAVGTGQVCVSQLGEKEIYYWPEKKIYNTKSVYSNKSLNEEINLAKVRCIK